MRQFINKDSSRIIVFTCDTHKDIKKYENNDEWFELFEWEFAWGTCC